MTERPNPAPEERGPTLPPPELEGLPPATGTPGPAARLAHLEETLAQLCSDFGCETGWSIDWLGARLQELRALQGRERARTGEASPTIVGIALLVAAEYELTTEQLCSETRTAPLVNARHVAFTLARALTDRSLSEIGDHFGGRDHSTVLHGVDRVRELAAWQLDLDGAFLGRLNRLAQVLEPGSGPCKLAVALFGGVRREFYVQWKGLRWLCECRQYVHDASDGPTTYSHVRPLQVVGDERAIRDPRTDQFLTGSPLTRSEAMLFEERAAEVLEQLSVVTRDGTLSHEGALLAEEGAESVPRGTLGGPEIEAARETARARPDSTRPKPPPNLEIREGSPVARPKGES